MIHELKIKPAYFNVVHNGDKSFEVRKKDRNYKVGDYLALNEYDDGYTGRTALVKVKYILDNNNFCKSGFVIMGIERCDIVKLSEKLTIAYSGGVTTAGR